MTGTNGDRIERAVGRVGDRVAKKIARACEHPDEALIVALPALTAFYLSSKYDMDLLDHVLVTQAGYQAGELLLKAYREWKARPVRTAKEAI